MNVPDYNVSLLFEHTPYVLPPDWEEVESPMISSRCWRCSNGLKVIASVLEESDGRDWLHVSVSRTQRLPSWKDLAYVKGLFIGAEHKAIQVFAPADEHVNIHPFCLHLFRCLDGDPLPDFRVGKEL
jgi:hypothetical protein